MKTLFFSFLALTLLTTSCKKAMESVPAHQKLIERNLGRVPHQIKLGKRTYQKVRIEADLFGSYSTAFYITSDSVNDAGNMWYDNGASSIIIKSGETTTEGDYDQVPSNDTLLINTRITSSFYDNPEPDGTFERGTFEVVGASGAYTPLLGTQGILRRVRDLGEDARGTYLILDGLVLTK